MESARLAESDEIQLLKEQVAAQKARIAALESEAKKSSLKR
jgi:hypothetical protein